ncbi:MAG: PIN domain-containing protein [Gemmatimonadetes bacterium]|nr:PIN domain-containing protein [Gemmatimonadota bacterium]
MRLGSVRLGDTFSGWSRKLLASPRFVLVELTYEIVLRAEEFYAIPERGDRLIAATAAHLGYPLITRDPEIARAAGVEVIW